VLAFPFITGAFATFVVQERMTKAKHLQTVAGVKPSAYWLSTYSWDILNYQFPCWIVVILMFVFNVNSFTTTDGGALGGTILTIFFFGPAAAGFTYCVTFLFTSPSACNLFVIVFNFFIGFVGPLVSFILRLIGEIEALSNAEGIDYVGIAAKIEWALRIFPAFNFSKALFFTINIDVFAAFSGDPNLSVWSKDILLYEFIFLVAQSFIYIWLAITLDRLSTTPGVAP